MAGPKDGKDSKDGKDGGKDKRGKESGEALLKRLAEELASLRAEVDTIKRGGKRFGSGQPFPSGDGSEGGDAAEAGEGSESGLGGALARQLQESLNGERDAAIATGYACRMPAAEGMDAVDEQNLMFCAGLKDLLLPSDSQVARLGAAFSSAPKVALIRALLLEGTQSAAKLGDRAGLTTGSLYHHLRELSHAEVITAAGRNRFALTPSGRQAALLMFALSGGPAAPHEK